MSLNLKDELVMRAASSHLPEPLLRAVYLREVRQSHTGGPSLVFAGLQRVDKFIRYATVRDLTCGEDRDLVPSCINVQV